MKRLLIAACLTLSLAAPLIVLAQSSREVSADASAVAARNDKQLNAAYEALLKDIRAHHDKDRADLITANLRETQRAWLKYRDAQLDFVGTYNEVGSASARNVGLTQYSHELTAARIKDFQAVPNPF